MSLNLPDPFPGNPKPFTDRCEGLRLFRAKAKTAVEDSPFSGREYIVVQDLH